MEGLYLKNVSTRGAQRVVSYFSLKKLKCLFLHLFYKHLIPELFIIGEVNGTLTTSALVPTNIKADCPVRFKKLGQLQPNKYKCVR